MARLRILYLLIVSLAVFLVRDPRFVPLALIFHLAVAGMIGVGWRRLGRMLWNLRFFFLFLVVMQAFLPPRGHFLVAWLTESSPPRDPGERPSAAVGMMVGVFQIAQIYTMVLVSSIARAGGGRAFAEGLRGLGVPQSVVGVINACFDRLDVSPDERRKRRKSANALGDGSGGSPIRALLRGDVGWIIDRLEGEIGDDLIHKDRTADAHDARLMTRIAMVLLSLRMLKVTPGTGVTPGYQNVIVVPLLCLAADRTRGRWGATTVGTATGALSVMLGLGRNGIFILPAHVLPGVVIDVLWRLMGGDAPGRLACMMVGTAAGFARFTGMFLVLLLLDNRELLAAIPFFSAGHVFFGALSGAVTHALIREARTRDATP